MSVAVDPIEIEPQVVVQGGDPVWRSYTPGVPRFGQARLRFHVTDPEFDVRMSAWIKEAIAQGDAARRNIDVVLLDKRGRDGRRYSLLACLPLAYAPGALRLVNGPCPKCEQATDLAELVVQIGSIDISDPPPNSRPRADEFVRNRGFTVELKAGPEPGEVDRSWRTVSGGAVAIENIEATVGNDGSRQFKPGKAYVTDVELTGPVTPSRDAMLEWIRSTDMDSDSSGMAVERIEIATERVERNGDDEDEDEETTSAGR